MFNRLTPYTPLLQAALRIMTGLLFIEHGTMKLFQFPAGGPGGGAGGGPPLLSLLGVAAIMELVGGTLFALGALTRPVAFLLSGQMAVAYFMAHGSRNVFPATNGGDAAVLFCFIFLFFVGAGPGAFAIDTLRKPGNPS